jgi:hypothetical protein
LYRWWLAAEAPEPAIGKKIEQSTGLVPHATAKSFAGVAEQGLKCSGRKKQENIGQHPSLTVIQLATLGTSIRGRWGWGAGGCRGPQFGSACGDVPCSCINARLRAGALSCHVTC